MDMGKIINNKTLLNKYFGKLLVLSLSRRKEDGHAIFKCRCICNKIIYVRKGNLLHKNTRSCGCSYGKHIPKNIQNRRFGRWKVLEKDKSKLPGKGQYWFVKCDCGIIRSIKAAYLLHGQTKSCGCRQKEIVAALAKINSRTHGLSKSMTYRAWTGMWARCRGDCEHFRKYYSHIKVCKRWKKFENFILDLGRRPTKKHSLERVNNEKGYCPSNCKWLLLKYQARNKRNTIKKLYKNKLRSIPEISKLSGVSLSCLYTRHERGNFYV